MSGRGSSTLLPTLTLAQCSAVWIAREIGVVCVCVCVCGVFVYKLCAFILSTAREGGEGW
jgi:hypothetical protein